MVGKEKVFCKDCIYYNYHSFWEIYSACMAPTNLIMNYVAGKPKPSERLEVLNAGGNCLYYRKRINTITKIIRWFTGLGIKK